MHICMVITSLTGGGAERVVLTLARGLQRQGCKITIFSLLSKRDYIDVADMDIVTLSNRKKIPSIFSKCFYNKLADRIRQHISLQSRHNDVVMLYHLPDDYVIGDILGYEHSYYCVHTSPRYALQEQKQRSKSSWRRLKARFGLLRGKQVIAVSDGIKQELESDNALLPASCERIYNPFDIAAIRVAAEADFKPPGFRYILHIGRAARVKRHDVLFKALASVDEGIKLVLLSKDENKLARMAKRYGVSDRVLIAGFTDNPYVWMRHAEAVVLTSDYEGFGNVLVESLACGTPAISTDCPYGPSEILTGELRHLLVAPGNAEKLASKLNQILAEPAEIDRPAILEQIEVDDVARHYLNYINAGSSK